MSRLHQLKTGLGYLLTSFYRPSVLVLELSSACNANCIMCSRGKMDPRESHMDFELVKKAVLDARALGIKQFQLSFYGEPLLSPDLVEAVTYIKKQIPESFVMISTNAVYLTKIKAEALMTAGMDLFKISIEGADKETYEKVRLGLKWDTLLQNVSDLKELIDSGRYRSRFLIYGLKLEAINYDLKAYIKFWQNYTDEVYVRNEHNLKVEKFYQKFIPCYQPFAYLVVLADGRVSPCAFDWYAKHTYGDLTNNSITPIWFSLGILKYRLLHILGLKKLISACRNCQYYPLSGPLERS